MGLNCISTSEPDDFALASQHLATNACCAALGRVRGILAAPASAAGLDQITHLAGLTRRIGTCLESGSHALAQGDSVSAALENARALVLMNSLSLAAGPSGVATSAPPPSVAQKSGSTG